MGVFLVVGLCGPIGGLWPGMAWAASGQHKVTAAKPGKEGPKKPEIPETVYVHEPMSLSVVLPKSGAIRQMVFEIWLEGTSKASVAVIERLDPKIVNAFLQELQRLMYSDTTHRYNNREPGKRGFRYAGPAMLASPPPQSEEALTTEADAAEKDRKNGDKTDNGEAVAKEPPFSPFPPAHNRYFAALQGKLLVLAQGILPPDTIRSVQIRKFYDHWPGDV